MKSSPGATDQLVVTKVLNCYTCPAIPNPTTVVDLGPSNTKIEKTAHERVVSTKLIVEVNREISLEFLQVIDYAPVSGGNEPVLLKEEILAILRGFGEKTRVLELRPSMDLAIQKN